MKLPKAKTASLISKIVAVLWIVIAHIVLLCLLSTGKITSGDMEVVSPIVSTVGFTIMGIFGTVDLNLLAEKFATNKEQ